MEVLHSFFELYWSVFLTSKVWENLTKNQISTQLVVWPCKWDWEKKGKRQRYSVCSCVHLICVIYQPFSTPCFGNHWLEGAFQDPPCCLWTRLPAPYCSHCMNTPLCLRVRHCGIRHDRACPCSCPSGGHSPVCACVCSVMSNSLQPYAI